MVQTSAVPRPAAWLGGAGLLPFAVLALASLVLRGSWGETAAQALLAYGASILSFLGGIRWGIAISRPGVPLWRELSLSVLPSLIAWAALLLPRGWGMGLLALALLAQFWLDLRATREGLAPAWYPSLRLPLTVGAAASVLVGAMLQAG